MNENIDKEELERKKRAGEAIFQQAAEMHAANVSALRDTAVVIGAIVAVAVAVGATIATLASNK